MAINKNFIVDAGLEVKASATVNTSLAAGSLTVTGLSNQVGAAVFSNTVNIAGATTLTNLLTVNQTNTTGSANVGGLLNVVGNTTVGGTFSVSGAANVLSTFGVSGAATLANTLGVTGATTLSNTLNVSGNTVLSGTANITGLATFANAVVIQGNLTVQGTTTTVNTQNLNVADNIVTLNSDWVGAPSENAGIEINRGSSANVVLRWNETTDVWEITQDGTNYGRVHSKLTDVVLGTDTSGAYIATATSSTPALTLSGTGVETATLTGSIRTANTTVDGIVTLTDSIANTSGGVAGSATAVKTAYDSAVTYASNASNIGNGTLAAARLATSGVAAGQYGTSSAIPIITVDDRGRVTALSTTSVAGVTGYTFTAANNTLTISTGTGSTFSANVNGLTGTFGINISGTAAAASSLVTGNSYQGVNFTATGRFLAGNGSASSPSIAFSSDGAQDTGFYWSADGYINMTNNGAYSGQFGPGGTLAINGTMTASQFNGSGAGLTGTASSLTAGAANAVAWTNVSGRPTNVSSFTNDSGYITSGGRAYPRNTTNGGDLNFYVSGQGGQSTWLWGTGDGYSMYLYNPSNFSVSYASSAGNADTVDGLHASSGVNNVANQLVRTDGSGYIQAGYIHSTAGNEGNNSSPPRVWGTNGSDSYMRTYLTSALSVGYASSAGSASSVNGNIQGTLVGNLTWNNAVNILVGGESSFDISSGGQIGFFDSPRGNYFISCTQSDAHVRMVQNGGNVYVYGSRLYNDSGQQAVFNNGGTWGINITGSAGSASSASYAGTVGISYNNDTNSTFQMLWGSGNSVYGTGGIYCNPASDIIYAGDFYVTSDDRLKNRVGNVQNALAAVNSLNGFKFTWNEKAAELRNYTNETTQVGVSAQEVEAILPEAVHTDADGYKTVSYDSLVPLLIEAVKELTEKVARLEAR